MFHGMEIIMELHNKVPKNIEHSDSDDDDGMHKKFLIKINWMMG